jgi:hypothetical protein
LWVEPVNRTVGRSFAVESSEIGRRETSHQGLRVATGIGSSASSTPRNLRRAQPPASPSSGGRSPSERERFGWVPDVQLEESAGDGHFVHLVDPDRFATRLRQFVDTAPGAAEPKPHPDVAMLAEAIAA